MFRNAVVPLVAAASALFAATSQALAQEYEVTDLGSTGYTNVPWSMNQHGDVAGFSRDNTHSVIEGFVCVQGEIRYVGFLGGRTSSSMVAINNLGHAVGTSNSRTKGDRAFVWTGHKTDLGTLGGEDSWGKSINDLGQVVGASLLPGNQTTRAFLWENGEMRALPTLGGERGGAHWINNAGQIVGTASIENVWPHQEYPVIWENGRIHQLPPLDGPHLPRFIHDNGDIVGLARLGDPGNRRTRAVVWRNREILIELGTLASGSPGAGIGTSVGYGTTDGVNGELVIVGMSTNAAGNAHVPFIWRNREMVQLDDLMPEPWVALNVGPGCINDAGQIVVEAKIPGENGSRALLLTPIDQPCYPDCDQSTGAGMLDVFDFLCFQNSFVNAQAYACDCDTSTGQGVCDIFDFLCFQDAFVGGCS